MVNDNRTLVAQNHEGNIENIEASIEVAAEREFERRIEANENPLASSIISVQNQFTLGERNLKKIINDMQSTQGKLTRCADERSGVLRATYRQIRRGLYKQISGRRAPTFEELVDRQFNNVGTILYLCKESLGQLYIEEKVIELYQEALLRSAREKNRKHYKQSAAVMPGPKNNLRPDSPTYYDELLQQRRAEDSQRRRDRTQRQLQMSNRAIQNADKELQRAKLMLDTYIRLEEAISGQGQIMYQALGIIKGTYFRMLESKELVETLLDEVESLNGYITHIHRGLNEGVTKMNNILRAR